MVEAVWKGTEVEEEEHNDQLRRKVRREEVKKARQEKREEENIERLVADIPKRQRRASELVPKRKIYMSRWITFGPGFDLSVQGNVSRPAQIAAWWARAARAALGVRWLRSTFFFQFGAHPELYEGGKYEARGTLAHGAGVKKEPFFLRGASGGGV
uniref:Uncharacterized protein n=1 Tax=Heterosigma akashiwo TaxID=2829 RepID=A0A7S4DD74_HETAK